MAKRSKTTRKRVDTATVEARGLFYAEHYAIHRRLPEMLTMRQEYLQHSLAEVETMNLPSRLKRDITNAAMCGIKNLESLEGHVARGEIAQAVLAAEVVGLMSERIVRFGFQGAVEQNNKRIVKKAASVVSERDKADCRQKLACELFNEFSPEEIKTRGRESVYKEIAEIMQARLQLTKKIPPDTVRKYITQKNSGNG